MNEEGYGDDVNNDTIAALATFPGNAGINIIRISGDNALGIAGRVFVSKNKNKIKLRPRYLHYGYIVDGEKMLDEVLISYMQSPNTYTKEDIVEINCHGGVMSAKMILDLVIREGCRPADRGEFTKRAFLNGRIDLAQAEAVIDIINSKTDVGHDVSLGHLKGRLSREINALIDSIMDMLANIEVNIDFPEYDEDQMTIGRIRSVCAPMIDRLESLISTSDTGKIFKEGIRTAILGKPNVGKSSMMNFLLNENRAIVTDIPGTTRDTIEEYIDLDGIPLRIADTAGIRETDDKIEKIGVKKAIEKVEEADLVIMIFDGSRPLNEEDRRILDIIKDKRVIYIKNKSDLDNKLDLAGYENIEAEMLSISIAENRGLKEITEAIRAMFFSGKIDAGSDVIINNARHKNLLIKAKDSLIEVLSSIDSGMPVDYIEVDLKDCMESLGLIIGRAVSDDLTDKIFSEFCIGK